jgi:hypothetical protein
MNSPTMVTSIPMTKNAPPMIRYAKSETHAKNEPERIVPRQDEIAKAVITGPRTSMIIPTRNISWRMGSTQEKQGLLDLHGLAASFLRLCNLLPVAVVPIEEYATHHQCAAVEISSLFVICFSIWIASSPSV